MNRFLYFILLLIIAGFAAPQMHAQLEGLHGEDSESRLGVHSGNQFRVTFYNDGTYGTIGANNPEGISGEWPINSRHYYLVDGNIFVGSELTNHEGLLFHILSETKSANQGGSTGDKDPITGAWWTFLPLPGFADPTNTRVAMAKGSSEWPDSWPANWPDKNNDLSDPGWANDAIDNNPLKAAWNGYFGKNIFNADEESFFIADDYMNREFMADFLPDSSDPSRGGLGLRIAVRGFQWAKASVEDAIFVLYDIQNIGEFNHDKMIFGYKIGNNMGDDNTGSDAGDDGAEFVRDEGGIAYNIAYTTDGDDIGRSGWNPVGFFGGAFLESPGNPFDGIDNDNDGTGGPGDVISESIFNRGTLQANSPNIILIDYSNPSFPRSQVTTLSAALAARGQGPNDTLYVNYGSRIYKFWAGKELLEVGDNLVDDNLNGVIDENRGQPDEGGIVRYLYLGYKYHNYETGAGSTNPLLDERRDDGVDNDGDWVGRDEGGTIVDDLGADGIGPNSRDYTGPDFGEGDGIPTNGEPHFDKTDITESDQLGLTSVNLYDWGGANNRQDNDEGYWNLMLPGIFSLPQAGGNVELLFGSGYFPLPAGITERISMGIISGLNRGELLSNTRNVTLAYSNNYNFSKAPNTPSVSAIPGDNRVTLFWDDFAEQSDDPITGNDFEGYRIYRSTDPSFNDGGYITDARYGSKLWSIPIAEFDYNNDIYGINFSVPTLGVQFDLGTDNGLRHYFVDTTAVNGTTYFYAVTSYDKGSIPIDPTTGRRSTTLPDSLKIDPSECAKFVAIQQSGDIEKGKNVVVVRPEAPSAGFVAAHVTESGIQPAVQNTAQGSISFDIVADTLIRNNHKLQLVFQDSITTDGYRVTKSYTLTDLSANNEEIISENAMPTSQEDEQFQLVQSAGIRFNFLNNPAQLAIDSASSGWSKGGTFYGYVGSGIPVFSFLPYTGNNRPRIPLAANLEIRFNDIGVDTSKGLWRKSTAAETSPWTFSPAVPVNFTIIDKKTNNKVPFGFREYSGKNTDLGKFTYRISGRRTDEIVILSPHPTVPDSLVPGFEIRYVISAAQGADTLKPGVGDELDINMQFPFLSHDMYEFTIAGSATDPALAKEDMDMIRVVPNPYIVSNAWEPGNTYASGRGERELHFTHLPPKCTIRIFNVRGQLVQTLEHDAGSLGSSEQVRQFNGSLTWNMLSKDNLEISYGIYVFHIDAPGVGEKIGKFVVIK